MSDVTHERTTKPSGATGSPKLGASPTMGEPGTPSGPNETEEGIIKVPGPTPPGEEQIGLIGGDPGEPLQSTPPLDEAAPSAANKAAKAKVAQEATSGRGR